MAFNAGLLMLIYLLAINVVAFLFYGLDKHRAVKHLWRIPEATLLIYAFIGGGVGALLGMLIFHHKTRKWTFRILVPLSMIVWLGIVIWMLS